MKNTLKYAKVNSISPQPKCNLELIRALEPGRQLKVYSSSPTQRLSLKLDSLIKTCSKLVIIGFLGSALSYFWAVSLESEVTHQLKNFENQMKNREDLKSYLGKVYSWQNMNEKAKKLNFKQAQKFETAPKQKSNTHSLLTNSVGF